MVLKFENIILMNIEHYLNYTYCCQPIVDDKNELEILKKDQV